MQPLCHDVAASLEVGTTIGDRRSHKARSADEIAFRFGPYYDSYLATRPDRELCWSSDRQGLVSFARVGRHLHVGGGLIAEGGKQEMLLAEVVARADDRDERLLFYNVAAHDLPLFRQYGFQATKLGEEAIIDLDDWACRGGAFEWLRRQVNYCRRQRLTVTECLPDRIAGSEWSQLTSELGRMSAAFLEGKPQTGELRFLDDQFDSRRLGRRRVFAARSRQRIEAILVCNPYRNGDCWAFETYRRQHDAVRGVIPFLMHETIELLRQEDLHRVSLCLVPGLRAEQALPGDSALVRRGLHVGSRYFNFVFDAAGQYHYKSRFRPRFEDRYLCARPAVGLASAWSVVRLLGVLDVEPRKLARTLGRRLFNPRRRRTLATPAA